LGQVRSLLVHLGRRQVDQVSRRLDLRRHVGEHELKTLECRDRLSELPALLRVAHRVVERALGQAQGLRAYAWSRTIQDPERDLETEALVPQPVPGRYARFLEGEHRCRRPSNAELVLELDRRPGTFLALQHEGRDAAMI